MDVVVSGSPELGFTVIQERYSMVEQIEPIQHWKPTPIVFGISPKYG
ncbi:MAG: hypothetical protein HYY46_20625 [Deltaproteobacteria bacterium]|nr:hypothetical protein [Deltaproteobacteria bacterium]